MNMAVRHLQITLICFVVVTCQANFFYERTDLRTMLPRDDVGEHLDGNSIFCAVKCSLNSNCVAFWTNTNTSACRLITSLLTSADMISSGSNDWHYYDYGKICNWKSLQNVMCLYENEISVKPVLSSH